MTMILDLVASTAVRGTMIILMLKMTVTLNSALYDKTAMANARTNLGVTTEVMYEDIRATTSFSAIDSVTMAFTKKVSATASSQSVTFYRVYDASTGLWKLYRNVDGSLMMIGNNLESISFVFRTSTRTVTTLPAQVKSVDITLVARVYGLTEEVDEQLGIGTQQTTTRQLKVFPLNL